MIAFRTIPIGLFVWCATLLDPAFAAEKTMAEELGHARGSRLLIVNADDFGMSHAVNTATLRALRNGSVSSASAMAPCPWFPEAARMARDNPELSVGLHLTLTAEWKGYRWGPVLPAGRVPSLVEPDGFFPSSRERVDARAKAAEVKAEFRAQIELALSLGMKLSHIDSHMGVYHYRADLFQAAVELANEYALPMRVVMRKIAARKARVPHTDHWAMYYDTPNDQRPKVYRDFFRSLEPGVTELTVHLADDTPEWAAIAHDRRTKMIRVTDARVLASAETRRVIKERGITLVRWRDLQGVMRRWQKEDGPKAVQRRAGLAPRAPRPRAPAPGEKQTKPRPPARPPRNNDDEEF